MIWYAPHGENLKGNSVNDSGINTFADKVVESLVRETLQNSLDVVLDQTKPLRMSFSLKKYKTRDIPNIEHFINIAVPKAKERWKRDKAAIVYLNDFEKKLKEEYLYILKVSDYNTTGLEDYQWSALIEDAGSSYKQDEGAGGSFGIGKNAPFAGSYFRMLFYETFLPNGTEKSIGVTNFLSYEIEKYVDGIKKTYTTEGPLYLGSEERQPKDFLNGFNFPLREEPGTDIFVIGFNEIHNWQSEIIKHSIKNFMVSIHDEKVVIEVGDKVVNKETLPKFFDIFLSDDEIERTKKYYDIYKNPHSVKVGLDDRFKKYGFKEEDAYLLIAEEDEANRRVLMTRKTGMQIYEMDRISAMVQFNAIFRAEGEKINRILREMENPRHDMWVPDLLHESKRKKYENLLRDLSSFFRNVVDEEFKIDEGEMVDAFGVSDFLPLDLEDSPEEDKLGDTALDLVIKERKAIKASSGKTDHTSLDKDWDLGSIGSDRRGRDESDGNEGKNTGKKMPPVDLEEKGDKLKDRNFKEIKDKMLVYRIIENDYINGKYSLLIKSDLNRDLLKINIKAVGESGDSVSIFLESATLNDNQLNQNNNIYLENVVGQFQYLINLKISETRRVKLEARIYESKK